MTVPTWLLLAVTAIVIVVYYGKVVHLAGEPAAQRVTGYLVDRTSLGRRWAVADLDGVTRLLIAGAMQALFLGALLLVLPVSAADLLPARWDLVLIGLGVLLGVAEAGLSTYVAYVGSRVAERWAPTTSPTGVYAWLSVTRGGWVRYYLRTASIAPTWLLVGATTLYVAGEELIFRGVILTLGSTLPAAAVVATSVLLFCLAQVFYTPGWQSALFPVLGALVVGVVHGCLFLVVPDITPLIVAHAVMFLVTVL